MDDTRNDSDMNDQPESRSEEKPTERPARRHPDWIRAKLPSGRVAARTLDALRRAHLATVCQEARCPNMGECFAEGTATFMILGRICTRDCNFCAVEKGTPDPVDPDEPARLAEAAAEMGLRHVVITSVTRDDLPDGGADHFRRCAEAVKERIPASTIELLIPDFRGDGENLREVLRAPIDVLNHNIETVPRLYDKVRPGADFERSLTLLHRAQRPGLRTKSGLMLGLGERALEIEEVLIELREVGCSIITLGQYLQPKRENLEIERYVKPEEFQHWARAAKIVGFEHVVSGPLVRSSYNAACCM